MPLPHFNLLLEGFRGGVRDLEQAFGRHVHWGSWSDPGSADLFIRGDACVLPFAEQRFDVVLAVECVLRFLYEVLSFEVREQLLRCRRMEDDERETVGIVRLTFADHTDS